MSKGKRSEEELEKAGYRLTAAGFSKEMITWLLFIIILSNTGIYHNKTHGFICLEDLHHQ